MKIAPKGGSEALRTIRCYTHKPSPPGAWAALPRFNRETVTNHDDLLVGNGDGTFRVINDVVQTGQPSSLSQADFNGDGKLDLVKPNPGVSVWPGNGDGTFQTGVTFPAGASPNQALPVDLNADKAPDLVVVNSGDNTISVLLNTVGTDFSISASAANPSTVGPGQNASATVSLTLLNAFINPVSLVCSVQPATGNSPTCSLNPSSVEFDDSGKASAQMTSTAGNQTASLLPLSTNQELQPLRLGWLAAGLAFTGMGFRSSKSKGRVVLGLSLGCLAFAALIAQSGCGGGSPGSHAQAY